MKIKNYIQSFLSYLVEEEEEGIIVGCLQKHIPRNASLLKNQI